MGLSVSASYAILAFAVLVALGTLFAAVQNTAEEGTSSLDDQFERSGDVAETDIAILDSSHNVASDTLVVSVKNTGSTRLSVAQTDVIVDGRYVPLTGQNTSVDGDGETQVWARGETLRVEVSTQPPERVKVVTEHGVAAFSTIRTFSLTNNIVFTQSDDIQLLGPGESVTAFGETATVIGPPVTEFGSNDVAEIPATDSNGNVFIVNEDGERAQLATGAKTGFSKLTAGRWQGSAPSVFFVDQGTQDIVRVTGDGSTSTISVPQAEGVAGIADFDGDGADELVFGGSEGTSDSITYIDDDGSVTDTSVNFGRDNGIGVGEPADFDGDGTARVPIVDGSQDILLVAHTGATEKLDGSGTADKAPLGTADLDTDGDAEIYYVDENNNLEYVDNVTDGGDVRAVTDDQGNPVAADDDAGAA